MSQLATIPETFSIFGFEATGEIPADLPALIEAIGDKKVYDAAISLNKFHKANAKWRSLLLAALIAHYNLNADDYEKATVSEFKKLREASGASEADFITVGNAAFQKIVDENTFIALAQAAESASSVGKEWISQGEALISLVNQKAETTGNPPSYEKFLEKMRTLVPNARLSSDTPDGEEVGAILKAYATAEKKRSLDSLV